MNINIKRTVAVTKADITELHSLPWQLLIKIMLGKA